MRKTVLVLLQGRKQAAELCIRHPSKITQNTKSHVSIISLNTKDLRLVASDGVVKLEVCF